MIKITIKTAGKKGRNKKAVPENRWSGVRGVPETAGWSMKVAAGKKYSVMACPVRNAAVPVSDGRSGVPGFVPARPRLRQQSSARPRIVGPLR